jgi:hypothetical protein
MHGFSNQYLIKKVSLQFSYNFVVINASKGSHIFRTFLIYFTDKLESYFVLFEELQRFFRYKCSSQYMYEGSTIRRWNSDFFIPVKIFLFLCSFKTSVRWMIKAGNMMAAFYLNSKKMILINYRLTNTSTTGEH